jgi:hypothetical protein
MSSSLSTREVKRAKSAFQFYQAANLKALKQELGSEVSMGDCMTEVSVAVIICRDCCVYKLNAHTGIIPSSTLYRLQLSSRWKALSDDDRQPYLEQEAEDRHRLEEESRQADLARLEESERKRAALQIQEGEDYSSRGARAKVEQD